MQFFNRCFVEIFSCFYFITKNNQQKFSSKKIFQIYGTAIHPFHNKKLPNKRKAVARGLAGSRGHAYKFVYY